MIALKGDHSNYSKMPYKAFASDKTFSVKYVLFHDRTEKTLHNDTYEEKRILVDFKVSFGVFDHYLHERAIFNEQVLYSSFVLTLHTLKPTESECTFFPN